MYRQHCVGDVIHNHLEISFDMQINQNFVKFRLLPIMMSEDWLHSEYTLMSSFSSLLFLVPYFFVPDHLSGKMSSDPFVLSLEFCLNKA